MRAAVVWLMAAVAGAVVGALGALASHWWTTRDLPSYGAPRRYVDYLPAAGTDWAALLVPAALTGAVLGLVVLAAARLAGPRSRLLLAVGAVLAGAVVAVLGVVVARQWSLRDVEYHGYYSYSPLPNMTNRQDAYASELSVTVDTGWASLLLPAAAAGAVMGLLVLVFVGPVRGRFRSGSLPQAPN